MKNEYFIVDKSFFHKKKCSNVYCDRCRNFEFQFYSVSELTSIGMKYAFYKGTKLHRLDGPAAEWEATKIGPTQINGGKLWFKDGLLHREDGPAIDGSSVNSFYYYNGNRILCKDTNEFIALIKFKAFI